MPRDITVTFDDGSTHVYQGAPDDLTPDQVQARASKDFGKTVTALDGGKKAEAPGAMDGLMQASKNAFMGTLRGAGSIGATILSPVDIASDALAGKGLSLASNRGRRDAMTKATEILGADPDSIPYKMGKLGAEVAGTLGVGNALGLGARAVGAAPEVVNALGSAGFSTGAPAATTLAGRAADLALRTGAGAVTGGASAGLVDPEQAKTGALIGGVLPGAAKAIGAVGSKIGAAIRGGEVSPEVAALAQRAKELGIDVPADRIVNSKPLDAVASGLNYVPFSGRAATERKMAEQLNQAGSRLMGQDTPNMNQALRRAGSDLGAKFDQTLSSNTVKVDPAFLTDLADASNKASRELGTDQAGIIAKQVDDIIAKATTGEIDGQAAYNIKKTLDRIGNRNSPEAWYALDLKGALMRALDRSLGPADAQAFAKTREQYSNMLALEKLAKNGVEGEISVARLANLKNINNQPLQELADIAAQFVKPREGMHGAMQRAVVGSGGAAAAASTAGLPGLVGVAGLSAASRGVNSALASDTMRKLMLNEPTVFNALTNPELQQNLLRAAPVISTGR